jgi:PAS domain S-box-containing protein
VTILVLAALVAERRRAEAAEREQRERFAVTLSSIEDAVIATDPQARVTFMNAVAALLTGWRAAEALGKNIAEVFQIINEHTRQGVDNPVVKVIREGTVAGLANHTVLVSRDGVERLIDDSGAPIRDPEGRLLGVVLVFRDITERRHAALAQAYLAAIVESSDDAIIGKTLEGNIVSWNRGAERLYGYSAAEVIGGPITILVPPDRPDEILTILQRLRRGQAIDHYETVWTRKDGQAIPVSLTISPILDSDRTHHRGLDSCARYHSAQAGRSRDGAAAA